MLDRSRPAISAIEEKSITSVQPDEADEMVDYNADVTVQSGHQIRHRTLLSLKVGQ